MILITDEFPVDCSGDVHKTAEGLGNFFCKKEVPNPVANTVCVFIPSNGKTAAYIIDSYKEFGEFIFWKKIDHYIGFHTIGVEEVGLSNDNPIMVFFTGNRKEVVGLGVGADPELLESLVEKITSSEAFKAFDVIKGDARSQLFTSWISDGFVHEFQKRVYKSTGRVVK